jgi:hypothetical protein
VLLASSKHNTFVRSRPILKLSILMAGLKECSIVQAVSSDVMKLFVVQHICESSLSTTELENVR